MGKGSKRRPEDAAKIAANWPVASAKCPHCGSYDVETEHHDEDIEYGDGIMAAEWTNLSCNRCGEEWQE